MLPLWSIDTVALVIYATFIHPFPVLLIALCLLAIGYSLQSPVIQALEVYFTVTFILDLLRRWDARAGSGTPREVDWENEVVMITGGASGLGSLIAATYGMRGASVAVLDIKSLSGAELEEYEEKGVSYYKCDVGDRRDVQRTYGAVEKDLGTPTVLINNAAVVTGKQILDLTEKDIDRSYRTNILSHYHTIQALLPAMLQRPQGGTIVTVSSVLGHLGCAGLSDYTSAKAAQTAFHKSLKAELQQLCINPQPNSHVSASKIYPEAIRLLLVEPGQLTTPLFSRISTPSTFLAPPVEPADLARRIVDLVDRGVGGEIAMPLYAGWIACLDLLPAGFRALVRRLAGLDRASWRAFVLDGKKARE